MQAKNYLLASTQLSYVQEWDEKSDIYIIWVHEDERYFDRTISSWWGSYLHGKVVQNEERFIRFNLIGEDGWIACSVRVDPNRIFSREGIRDTLDVLNSWSEDYRGLPSNLWEILERQIEDFSRWITDKFGDRWIVALHTNENRSGKFTVSIQYPESEKYINPEMHESTFVITNNISIYEWLRDAGISVILSHDDYNDFWIHGWAIRNNRSYVNIEVHVDDISSEQSIFDTVVSLIH